MRGAQLHGEARRARFAAGCLTEARAIHRRRPADVPRHRPARGRTAPRRPGRADPLQRRRAGDGRLRHGAWPCSSPHEQGKTLHVFADETRPLLQGARLTAWELQQPGIDVTLICDSMAAQVMREGRVQAVVTGADRIAANGDTANKIGTYGVALLAARARHPVLRRGAVEHVRLVDSRRQPHPHRAARPREITHGFGRQTAPEGVKSTTPPSTSRRPG